MPLKLPRGLSGDQVVQALKRAGWEQVRVRGSHVMLQKQGRDYTLSVPRHRTIGPGLLRGLIRDAGLTVEQFVDLL
ncbi:MAG: type II toxin-antitoxin system HicA family toxin [Armatimonadetes bacterium]|nr:type II toxin-antitoxin system HicA family toxin [Armatimonadota bacterium]